jgi:hypothetical protein
MSLRYRPPLGTSTRGPPDLGVGVLDQIADKAQVERLLQVPVEVVRGIRSSRDSGGNGPKSRDLMPIIASPFVRVASQHRTGHACTRPHTEP